MARITIYASAFVAAFMAFAVTGGIRASEKVVQAEEHPAAALASPSADARIAFANSGNIRDWRADGTDSLYVQDGQGHWYHAALMGPCPGLPTTEQIGFLTRGPDELDKFSAIAVRGQRCQFSTLAASAAPPKQARAKAARE